MFFMTGKAGQIYVKPVILAFVSVTLCPLKGPFKINASIIGIDYHKLVICAAFLPLRLKMKALILQTPCVGLSRHILLMDVVKVRSMKAANGLTKADK